MELKSNIDIAESELKKIEKLFLSVPPISSVVVNIIRLIEREKSSISLIVKELAYDNAISADVIRIVNSPFYGFPQRISSLEHAVVVMGAKMLMRVVIAAWAKNYQSAELKGYGYDRGNLAFQSILGAFASKMLADSSSIKVVSDIVFTAAAIRNIGKVAVEPLVYQQRKSIISEIVKGLPFHIAEKKILGFNHTEVGYLLAKRWNFPEDLAYVIRYFREPSKCDISDQGIKKIVYCVHCGDIISMMVGVGGGVDNMLYAMDGTTFRVLGIKETDIENIYYNTISIQNDVRRELFEEVDIEEIKDRSGKGKLLTD